MHHDTDGHFLASECRRSMPTNMPYSNQTNDSSGCRILGRCNSNSNLKTGKSRPRYRRWRRLSSSYSPKDVSVYPYFVFAQHERFPKGATFGSANGNGQSPDPFTRSPIIIVQPKYPTTIYDHSGVISLSPTPKWREMKAIGITALTR